MQHLTHINNISVLFVVDPFESANNISVDEIENKYLLVLNLNELHLPKFNQNGFSIGGTTRQQMDTANKVGPGRLIQIWFQNCPTSHILLLFVIFKAQCLYFYAEI